MNKFVKALSKFTVVVSILLAVVLIAVAVLLILVPDFLLKVLYYGLIIGCIGIAAYIIISLIRAAVLICGRQDEGARQNEG